MSVHTQTTLKDPFMLKEVRIDDEIVNLIKVLWNYGIQTSGSCQDTNGQCQLEFPIVGAFDRTLHALLKILGVAGFSHNEIFTINVRHTPEIAVKGFEGTLPESYQIMFNSQYIELVTKEISENLI